VSVKLAMIPSQMSDAYTAVARELPETAVFKKADYTVMPAQT